MNIIINQIQVEHNYGKYSIEDLQIFCKITENCLLIDFFLKTPAPNAYNSEKGEEYLEGGIKHSFGVKPEPMNKFKTPAPNAYDSEKGEEYLEGMKAITIGARLREAKKFLTPAPNKYEVRILGFLCIRNYHWQSRLLSRKKIRHLHLE